MPPCSVCTPSRLMQWTPSFECCLRLFMKPSRMQVRIVPSKLHQINSMPPGVSPSAVRGSKTGVFIGCSASESHDAWSGDPENIVGYEMTGCTRSMFANRISYFFDFKGELQISRDHGLIS